MFDRGHDVPVVLHYICFKTGDIFFRCPGSLVRWNCLNSTFRSALSHCSVRASLQPQLEATGVHLISIAIQSFLAFACLRTGLLSFALCSDRSDVHLPIIGKTEVGLLKVDPEELDFHSTKEEHLEPSSRISSSVLVRGFMAV